MGRNVILKHREFTKWFKITLLPSRLSPRPVAYLSAKIVLSQSSDKLGWTVRVQK